MRQVLFTRAVLRVLSGLDPALRESVISAVYAFAANAEVDAKAMRNRSGHRLRVGDYRAIVEISRTTLTVVKVGHRSTVYRP